MNRHAVDPLFSIECKIAYIIEIVTIPFIFVIVAIFRFSIVRSISPQICKWQGVDTTL